jgi:N-acetyl-anhydromuramyl-L-alanine amidase AmpD
MKFMRQIDLIIIHCADTLPDNRLDVEDIRRWHKEQGWDDVGYHFVITTDGTLQKGRSIEKIGSHVQGYNTNSIGICLIGGKKDKYGKKFTGIQFTTLKDLLIRLTKTYRGVILGHCELDNKKTCPNFNVQQWLKENNIV